MIMNSQDLNTGAKLLLKGTPELTILHHEPATPVTEKIVKIHIHLYSKIANRGQKNDYMVVHHLYSPDYKFVGTQSLPSSVYSTRSKVANNDGK